MSKRLVSVFVGDDYEGTNQSPRRLENSRWRQMPADAVGSYVSQKILAECKQVGSRDFGFVVQIRMEPELAPGHEVVTRPSLPEQA